MHSFRNWTVRHRRLLGAGLVAVASLAGTSTIQAQLGTSGYGQSTPAQNSSEPPVAQPPATLAASTSIATERADFTIQLNETFSLRHEAGGLVKEVLASRPGIVKIDVDKDNASIIQIKGVNVGVTQVTIIARDRDNKTLAPTIKTVQVNPDISYIRSKVAETFPTANLKIIAGGPPGSLIVTGTVQSVEDVDPIRTFVNGIASQYRGTNQQQASGSSNDLVTYAVRVSGPQVVQLDVCLASVNRRELRQLGVDFFQQSGSNFLGTSIGGAGSLSITGTGTTIAPTVNSASSNFLFSSQQGANAFIGFLNALREERVGKIMSSPTVTALSGRPSRFIVGGEEPFGTSGAAAGAGGGAGSGVQFRPTGTVVGFLPVVLGDGRIRLTVTAENTVKTGDANQAGIIAPILATQAVGTTLELEVGQSLVIGGLTENVTSGTTQKYPILGDLPFVGSLFRNVNFTEEEKEFVIVVKVNLVEGLDCAQRAALRLPGQESRSPSDFELFIEGILEAPRGPRDPFPGRCYVPAFKNDGAFGARSGDCSVPHGLWNRNNGNCNTGACNTGCVSPAVNTVPAQAAPPAAQFVPSTTVTPASTAPQTLTPATTEVPVVSVPVVPASESPAPVIPAAETPKQVDLPLPPIPGGK
jgi:pilus assembly protein CpaC